MLITSPWVFSIRNRDLPEDGRDTSTSLREAKRFYRIESPTCSYYPEISSWNRLTSKSRGWYEVLLSYPHLITHAHAANRKDKHQPHSSSVRFHKHSTDEKKPSIYASAPSCWRSPWDNRSDERKSDELQMSHAGDRNTHHHMPPPCGKQDNEDGWYYHRCKYGLSRHTEISDVWRSLPHRHHESAR